jgi:hypothetical protein
MRGMTKRLDEAVKKIKVEHREELVVQFGVPQER